MHMSISIFIHVYVHMSKESLERLTGDAVAAGVGRVGNSESRKVGETHLLCILIQNIRIFYFFPLYHVQALP